MSVAFVTFILYGQIREVCMAGGQMQTGRMVGADGQDGRMVGTVREESCGTRSGSDELCLATGMCVFLYHVILQLELDVDVDVLT